MSLRPIKVTAILSTPLASEPPMLDSLCELAMCGKMKAVIETDATGRHTFPLVPAGQPVPIECLGKIPIPIQRVWIDDLPIPRCSSPIIPLPASDTHGHYHKKFEVEHASILKPSERTKIAASGGRFKSFRLPLRLRVVDRVVWFASLKTYRSRGKHRYGPARLRQLLNKNILAIGKKTSFGYGRVQEWIVEPMDEDWSWFAPSEHGPVLMRPLPASVELPKDIQGSRLDFGAITSPYWQQSLWRERVVPC